MAKENQKPRTEICGNCKWFNLEQGPMIHPVGKRPGACHRFPPQPIMQGQRMQVMHPPVPEFFWCGEFVPNVQVKT